MNVRYYQLGSGRSPVEEFLREQSSDIRSDFIDAVNLLISGHVLSMPVSRNLASIHPGLHELRLKDRTGQIRIFYFFKIREGIWMLHAMKKKTRQISRKDIELILKRIREV